MDAPPPSDDMPSLDALTGRSLGDFVLRDKLGQGGFGAVYRAEQPLLSREAVVKVLLNRHGGKDEVVQRFLREAQLAAQLDHPYAAHVYAFGAEPDGLLWIAMEHVRGTSLQQMLKTHGPLPLSRFVPLLERICEVVQAAHEQGIIHRDLKPANVMVISRAGRVLPKLLDFGIARLRADLVTGDENTPETVGEPASIEAISPEKALRDSVRTDLTRGGKLVGSPHYMAPEQWVDARTVDARADVYALGVLTYQCLTGRLPFDGQTVKEVAREHARKSVPPLPAELPAALNEVLARALAKKAEQRLPSATELAAQVREAARLEEDPAQLPQLPDSLRELLIAEAPQPLAEAVALLESARTTAGAGQAAEAVLRVVAHLLGALALAARSRVVGHEDDALRAHWAKLRSGTLESVEWAALARELVRPFIARREAHPVPELVALFFDEAGVENARAAALFAPSSPVAPDTASSRRLLATRLLGLTRLLSASSFLSSYLWAVARPEGLERWMGVRRSARTWAGSVPAGVSLGQLALVSREGALVLSLHPFIQLLSPAPGLVDEWFFLEGRGRHGAKLVAHPAGFERHDEASWTWLTERIAPLAEADATARAEAVAPYRGLAPFTAEDHDNFFGREREVEAFANRLRQQSLIAVVGPSGAGKSSFVQAGAIPALPPSWRALVVRPGPSPLLALEERLVSEGLAAQGLREKLKADPGSLGALLRASARERNSTWVLVVDQFEELITLCLDVEERKLYAEALVAAAEGPVRCVLTLRDDFLIRLQQLPALRDRLSTGLQLLATPAEDDLRRILTEPARRAGFAFEDADLPEEMVQAVAHQPGALALLSFTASQLWELRDRQLKLLGRKAYTAMGGVGGALGHHAEQTLAKLSPEEQPRVREAFRQLVTAEGTRAVLTRAELEQLLGGGVAAQTVIERLIHARLLVASEGLSGQDRIEVIHEALLASWPRLVRWQREDLDNARMRDQLRAAARQWSERGRPTGLLWRKDALTEYRLWRARAPGALTDVEQAFASASLDEEAKGKRLRRTLLTAAFAALGVGLVILTISQQQARRAQRAASESLLDLYEEQGRQLVGDGDAMRGLLFLSRAYSGGHHSAGLKYLVAKAVSGLEAQLATMVGHHNPIIGAAFSPDGSKAVTFAHDEKEARVWSGHTGAAEGVLRGHEGGVLGVWFTSDGRQLFSTSRDGTLRFWDGATFALTRTVQAHEGAAVWAELSADQRLAVTSGTDRTAKLWSLPAGTLVRTLEGHEDFVISARFRPGDKELVTCSGDGTARVWDVATGQTRHILRHQGPIYAVAYSPDGQRIVTTSEDKLAKLWDATTGALIAELPHSAPVMSASFSPDSAQVATASHEKEPRVWDARGGRLLRVLSGHSSNTRFVTFSPDGQRLLTGSGDGTAGVYDARTGERRCALVGHVESVFRAAASPDGARFLTGSLDGSAKLWDASRCAPALRLGGATEGTVDARFSGDASKVLVTSLSGHQLFEVSSQKQLKSFSTLAPPSFGVLTPNARWLVSAQKHSLELWETEGSAPARPLNRTEWVPEAGATSPDGRRVAIVSGDGSARVWRVLDGALELELKHSNPLRAVAFSADGGQLVTGAENGEVRLWDLSTARVVRTFASGNAQVVALSLSADGSRLLSGSWDSSARVFDTGTGELLATLAHPAEVSAVAFLDGSRLALTGCFDGTARVFEVESGRVLDSFTQESQMQSLELNSSHTRFVTTGTHEPARVWSLPPRAGAPSDVERLVRCFVPLRFDGERLVKSELTSCTRTSLAKDRAQVAQSSDHEDNL